MQLIPDTSQQALKQLSQGMTLLGVCAGFLLSYSVLAGDAQGQVNLLFLLLLFAFFPVAGLVLTVILMLRGGGKGFVGLILALPLWPRSLKLALSRLESTSGSKPWWFYQTQILGLSFSIGCLLLYVLLLLGSDISFVWRSTLLEPQDLLPALQVLALPWGFWPEAQPSIELIELTRDYRVGSANEAQSVVGLWWKYILAAQVSYNLLPRSLMLLVARGLYGRRLREDAARHASDALEIGQPAAAPHMALADVTTAIAGPYILLDWAQAAVSCHHAVQKHFGPAAEIAQLGPLQPASENALPKTHSLVVLVKSWEPPLAELKDSLSVMQSDLDLLILPLDWNDQRVGQPAPSHLDEWRRFTATLPNWKVLQLEVSQLEVSQPEVSQLQEGS